MKRLLWLPLVLLLISMKDKPAYQLFTAEGKKADYSKMLRELEKADVVLFGELHNDPIAHWLQLEVAKDLYAKHGQNFVVGAEMFEADAQLVLNEYISGKVAESNFEAESRPWNNYKTDYKPILQFSKEKGVPFIATNVPRRYAAVVAASGMDALNELSPEAKAFMTPLPLTVDYELPGYKKMSGMFGGAHGGTAKSQQIIAAQALKDATMAHFIAKNLKNGKKMLHLNGSFHSDNYDGIYHYLKLQNPDLKIVTITTVWQQDLDKLEESNEKKADFVLVVPNSMTKTY